MRSLASVLAILTLILAWGLPTGEAHALDAPQGIPRLDSAGRWDLEKLGSKPFEIGTPNTPWERSLAFFVPKEVAEDPANDFLINLRLSLELSPQSGPGYGVFHVFVNDRAGEQISVLATRTAEGEIEAKWSTADLFLGPRVVPFRSRGAEVDVRNFTPLPGVRAGLNELSIQFDQNGGLKFAKARVGLPTGIQITHARPPELTIEPELPEDRAVKGEPFQVRFKLRNTGTVPAREVSVELKSSSPRLLTVEGDSRSFDLLRDEKEVSFKVLGRKYGAYKLTFNARTANANDPQVAIATPIVRAEDSGNGVSWGWIGLLLGLVGLVGWGISRRLPKRRP